jgi:hypothetical protein
MDPVSARMSGDLSPGDVVAHAWALDGEGKGEAARTLLRRASDAGDARAQGALAQHLVSKAPYDVADGVRWAMRAADKGDATAFHLLAVLAAEGLGVAQDWNTALDRLTRAAALGYAPAQGQLQLLAGEGGTDWARLRAAIDVPSLLKTPPLQWHSTAPRVAVVEHFLPPAMCDWLIARAAPELQRATVFNSADGTTARAQMRTNSGFGVETHRMDVVIALLRARIASLTGLPVAGFEDASILHYAVGERYTAHFDFFSLLPSFANEIALGGQRVLTFLVYLNDDFEGGETDFPTLGWRYRGTKGDALFFWNVGTDGLPDRRTLHAGLAPTRGEKWLYSQWVRFRAG